MNLVGIGPTELILCVLGIPAILLPIATLILIVMIFVRVKNIEEKLNKK